MPKPKAGPLVPPAILAKVPQAVVRALDISTVLRDALVATNYPEPYGPVIALYTLDSYYDADRREQRRIARAKIAAWKQYRPRKSSLFHDAHFYLISWARIAKLAWFIRDKTQYKRTGAVLRPYRAQLNERIDGRDHLEHLEERLPGGANQSRLQLPGDLINMANDCLTYGGRELDIGPSSLRLLTTIVEEFHTALLYDATEALAGAEPNGLLVLLSEAASRVQVARLTRGTEKLLKTTR